MPIRQRAARLLAMQIPLDRLFAPAPGTLKTGITPAGWGFVLLVLCGFLMSINFSNNLIFAMTFLLVSIAMVGWYHTRANLRGLVFGDWRVEPAFAGQRVRCSLRVDNRSKRMRHGIAPFSAKADRAEEVSIDARAQAELILYRKATGRGLLEPAAADLRSAFPLGTTQARMITGQLPACLVWPEPCGDQPLPDQASGRQAHLRSESGSYTDMRRYSPGDPLSRISWKAFAKTDELYTKQFDGAQGLPALWLRWDDVVAPGVEQKLSQLCRWILEVRKQSREFGLELPGVSVAPASDETHVRRCLETLALYRGAEKAS